MTAVLTKERKKANSLAKEVKIACKSFSEVRETLISISNRSRQG